MVWPYGGQYDDDPYAILFREQLAAKERRRQQQAALPIEEKIKIMDKLRRMAKVFKKIRKDNGYE